MPKAHGVIEQEATFWRGGHGLRLAIRADKRGRRRPKASSCFADCSTVLTLRIMRCYSVFWSCAYALKALSRQLNRQPGA